MNRRREDDYRGDVTYEVWRSGGNVDRIDDDRVSDNYHDGEESDYAAQIELNSQRAARDRMRDCGL